MSNRESSAPSRWKIWTGRVLSGLAALTFVMSGVMKLTHGPDIVKQFVGHLGFQEGALSGIGALELLCVAVYLVPRTSILGAVLLTGYLGGAIAVHVRAADAFVIPVVLGVLVWAGIYLRDARLPALLPLRAAGEGR